MTWVVPPLVRQALALTRYINQSLLTQGFNPIFDSIFALQQAEKEERKEDKMAEKEESREEAERRKNANRVSASPCLHGVSTVRECE